MEHGAWAKHFIAKGMVASSQSMLEISTHEPPSNLVAHTHTHTPRTHPTAPSPLPSPFYTPFQPQQKRQPDCTPSVINHRKSAVRQFVSSRLLDKHGFLEPKPYWPDLPADLLHAERPVPEQQAGGADE